MSKSVPEKTIMVSFVQASKDITPSRYYRLVNTDGAGLNFEAKVVDKLPAEGETHYIYLVKKATETQGNVYDEWMWVLGPEGTYQWEQIGVTGEVSVKLYQDQGENTDGAMSQKAVTDALKTVQGMIEEIEAVEPDSYTDEEWNNLWK